MIAVDTNILVYAHRNDSVFHERARRCLASLASGAQPWAIPWPCVYEFYSVVTHHRIYSPPSTQAQAFLEVEGWFGSPSCTLLSEPGGHWADLRRTLHQSHIIGPQVNDARIAALCASYGVNTLWSADRDFSRFGELKVKNPLV